MGQPPKEVRGSDFSGRMVSASDIARLAYCERQIRFDAIRGRRTPAVQRAARRRGRAAHQVFHEESERLAERSDRRGRCFVATMALGDTPDTLALRQFRDLYLRRGAWGRTLIAAYYRYSPAVCDVLADRPGLMKLARGPLRLLARAAAIAVRRSLQKDKGHDT